MVPPARRVFEFSPASEGKKDKFEDKVYMCLSYDLDSMMGEPIPPALSEEVS